MSIYTITNNTGSPLSWGTESILNTETLTLTTQKVLDDSQVLTFPQYAEITANIGTTIIVEEDGTPLADVPTSKIWLSEFYNDPVEAIEGNNIGDMDKADYDRDDDGVIDSDVLFTKVTSDISATTVNTAIEEVDAKLNTNTEVLVRTWDELKAAAATSSTFTKTIFLANEITIPSGDDLVFSASGTGGTIAPPNWPTFVLYGSPIYIEDGSTIRTDQYNTPSVDGKWVYIDLYSNIQISTNGPMTFNLGDVFLRFRELIDTYVQDGVPVVTVSPSNPGDNDCFQVDYETSNYGPLVDGSGSGDRIREKYPWSSGITGLGMILSGLSNDADDNKITNLAQGALDTDAVNLGQVNTLISGSVTNVVRTTDSDVTGWDFVDTELSGGETTLVPTSEAVKTYIDNSIAGGVTYKGGYNATTNTPDLDTSPSGVFQGDMYTVTAPGVFFTEAVEAGDVLIANQDDPTTLAHWTRVEKNNDMSIYYTSSQVDTLLNGKISSVATNSTLTGDGASIPLGVVSATNTNAGIVELASIAETDAGSLVSRAVTPASLTNVLSNIAAKLENGDGFYFCKTKNELNAALTDTGFENKLIFVTGTTANIMDGNNSVSGEARIFATDDILLSGIYTSASGVEVITIDADVQLQTAGCTLNNVQINCRNVYVAVGETPTVSTTGQGVFRYEKLRTGNGITGGTLGYWDNTYEATGTTWGNITGTLSSQTDLQNALDAKSGLSQGVNTLNVSKGDGGWNDTSIGYSSVSGDKFLSLGTAQIAWQASGGMVLGDSGNTVTAGNGAVNVNTLNGAINLTTNGASPSNNITLSTLGDGANIALNAEEAIYLTADTSNIALTTNAGNLVGSIAGNVDIDTTDTIDLTTSGIGKHITLETTGNGSSVDIDAKWNVNIKANGNGTEAGFIDLFGGRVTAPNQLAHLQGGTSGDSSVVVKGFLGQYDGVIELTTTGTIDLPFWSAKGKLHTIATQGNIIDLTPTSPTFPPVDGDWVDILVTNTGSTGNRVDGTSAQTVQRDIHGVVRYTWDEDLGDYRTSKPDYDSLIVGGDTDAIHDNVAGEINAITNKSDTNRNDILLIEDSEDSFAKKKATIAEVVGAKNKSIYIEKMTSSDSIPIMDTIEGYRVSAVRAVVTNGTSFNFSLKAGNAFGTSTITVVNNQQCDATTGEAITINSNDVTAGYWLWIEIDSVVGTDVAGTVSIEYTKEV
jgi:hypothetical protein